MTVRYEAVNAMLLNEFLKEHRKNEEQQATIDRQQKQIERLTVTVGWNVFFGHRRRAVYGEKNQALS